MITIKSKGLEKLIKDLDEKKSKSKQNVKNELVATIYDIQRDAKNLVNSQSSNTGYLANSIEVNTNNGENVSIYSKAEYAAYVEFGTRKFAQQYVSTLPEDWQKFAAQFKGQKSSGDFYQFVLNLIEWGKKIGGVDAQTAYNIARKIMVEGVQAKPYLYPSVRDNMAKFKERIKNII